MLCFFIYEAGNFWNNPCVLMYIDTKMVNSATVFQEVSFYALVAVATAKPCASLLMNS